MQTLFAVLLFVLLLYVFYKAIFAIIYLLIAFVLQEDTSVENHNLGGNKNDLG